MQRHSYGPARAQFGELFLPEGEGAFPVAVVVHGGFWRARHGRKLMRPLCRDLARRGWAAWNLEYRRLGRLSGGGWPRTLEDVAAGIDHLAELARPGSIVPTADGGTRRGLDLSHVVAVGHSAGGHLATWAATRPGLPAGAPGASPRVRVTGAAAQAGVVDLELAWRLRLSDGVVARLLGGPPEAQPERYAIASPRARLPIGIPLLLTHGGHDDVVPPVMSERFAEAARAAGDDCTLRVEPAEDHSGHLDPGNPLWTAVVQWLG